VKPTLNDASFMFAARNATVFPAFNLSQSPQNFTNVTSTSKLALAHLDFHNTTDGDFVNGRNTGMVDLNVTVRRMSRQVRNLRYLSWRRRRHHEAEVCSLVLVCSVAATSAVFAIGMGPSKIVADFKADETQTYSFTIFNTERKDVDFVVYARGSLSKYTAVQSNRIHLSTTDEDALVSYSVNIPENAPAPEPTP